MKFRLEQTELTDENGKVLAAAQHVTFHIVEASTVDLALSEFVRGDQAELVGEVLRFPGFQAVATARKARRVYTLQLIPVSDSLRFDGE